MITSKLWRIFYFLGSFKTKEASQTESTRDLVTLPFDSSSENYPFNWI